MGLLAGAALAAVPRATRGQPAVPLRRIGVLVTGAAPHPIAEALRNGLRAVGYVEGGTVAFEVRYAEGSSVRAGELAAELVGLRVEVIVAHFTPAVRAAMAATTTIPIVMAPAGAPVESGLVRSLSRPGGNVTGITNMDAELGGRRIQLLREIVPGLARVAVLASATDPFTVPFLRYMEEAAANAGVNLESVRVAGPDAFAEAFAAMARSGAQAVVMQGVFSSSRAAVVDLALRHRLPLMSLDRETTAAGGLVSLSATATGIYQRAVVIVDRILKGADPGDLPVEQPTTFEIVVNLGTARLLGVAIPERMLAVADEVIE
jgi:putative ABC transport system substrate-binding protein